MASKPILEAIDNLTGAVLSLKGGPGSGNFGHSGRPGHVGGSGGGGSGGGGSGDVDTPDGGTISFGPSRARMSRTAAMARNPQGEMEDLMSLAGTMFDGNDNVTQFASVAGVPDGWSYKLTPNVSPGGGGSVNVSSYGPNGSMSATIHSNKTIENSQWRFDLSDDIGQKRGYVGTVASVLAKQVSNAQAAGFKSISANASKTPLNNDHYTFPALGFDAKLPPHIAAKLPNGLKKAKSVSDILKTKSGREWWKKLGTRPMLHLICLLGLSQLRC